MHDKYIILKQNCHPGKMTDKRREFYPGPLAVTIDPEYFSPFGRKIKEDFY